MRTKLKDLLLRPSLKQIVFTSALVGMISMCYVLYGAQLDRESANIMQSLDLPISKDHFGTKGIDKFGRLVRRDGTLTVCGFQYSNFALCRTNAALHSNCLPLCDASLSKCPGCDLLQRDHQNSLGIAQGRCTQRAMSKCPLTLKPGTNNYDYAAFSTCCVNNFPPGPDACMCDQQQSAQPECTKCGNCFAATCGVKSGHLNDDIGRVNCVGHFSDATTPRVDTGCCPGAGVTSCDENGVPLTCGMTVSSDAQVQYYFYAPIKQCVPHEDCPTEQGGYVDSSGNGQCSYGAIATNPDYTYQGCVSASSSIAFDGEIAAGSNPTSADCLVLCDASTPPGVDNACGAGTCAYGNGKCLFSYGTAPTPPLVDPNQCSTPCPTDDTLNCGGDQAYQIWDYSGDPASACP